MLASQLISTTINPLMRDDTGEAAMVIMNLYHVRHLPILADTSSAILTPTLLGIISEDDLYANDPDKMISEYDLNKIMVTVSPSDHLFEVMAAMSDNKLTTIPVVNEKNEYLGIISQSDLMNFYATSFSFSEPGSILLLEIPKIDYSLEEISRLAESEGAAVLSSFLSEDNKNRDLILVTIKLNKMDISALISSFERHDYIIRNSFSEEEYIDELKNNYDHLMRYLDV